MRKKVALSLILAMLFSLFPQLMVVSSGTEQVLAANTTLATLEEVKGGVFVKKGGGTKEFKGIKGMALAQGDSVRTDKGGSATLVFSTGSKMSVGPNTLFTVSKAEKTKNSGGKISVKLKSGSVWNKVKKLANVEDEYQIETPTAVMGVRGTLFLVSVDPAGGGTTGSVIEGSVGVQENVSSTVGQGEHLVSMGNSVQVSPNQDQDSSQQQVESTPIDMNAIIESEDPSILAKIAQDTLERLQELQQQSQSYLAAYENTDNLDYLQAALQFAEISTQLADLTEQFMNSVEGTEQEQQMNQILQEYNTSVADLKQQIEQLANEVQDLRENLVEAAQEAGISPEEIDRILQNAPTAGAGVSYETAPDRPPLPEQPLPTTGEEGGGFTPTPQEPAFPKVVLYKSAGTLNSEFETGDKLEFRFDNPVKVEDSSGKLDLANINFWNYCISDAGATFGDRATLDYASENGYTKSISITLDDDSDLPTDGLTFTIPKESLIDANGNQATQDVQFTLPILIETNSDYSLYNEGAVVTNLTDAGEFNELDMGSYGSYKQIPQDFLLKGKIGEDLLGQYARNAKVKFDIWYYDQFYNRWYVTPFGSVQEEIPQAIDVEIAAFVKRSDSGEYTWQAKLPETMRDVINDASYRDYFIELYIEPSDSNAPSKSVVAGAFTIRNTPLEIVGAYLTSYYVEINFNKNLEEFYYEEPDEKLNLFKLKIGEKELTVTAVDAYLSNLTIYFEDQENLLGSADIHSALEISSSPPIKDRWGNTLVLNYKMYKGPSYDKFGVFNNWWLDHDSPSYVNYGYDNMFYSTGELKIALTDSLQEYDDNDEKINYKDYVRLIDSNGDPIENAIERAEYGTVYGDNMGLIITFNTEIINELKKQNIGPYLLELVTRDGTTLTCIHGKPFIAPKIVLGNKERLILGVIRLDNNIPWVTQLTNSGYFSTSLDLWPDYNGRSNSNLIYYFDEKLNVAYRDIKEYFVLKNYFDGYYRPTTARIISAEYKLGDDGYYDIVFTIDPGNLQAGGVIIISPNLTNIYGYGYGYEYGDYGVYWSEDNLPRLDYYNGDGTWGFGGEGGLD